MPSAKASFLDKVLGRIKQLPAEDLQTVLASLAQERAFLEMLFDTIEDGVLVVEYNGRIRYFNRAVTQLLGLPPLSTGTLLITDYLPNLDWAKLDNLDGARGERVVRHEVEVTYPRPRFLSLYVTPLGGKTAGHTSLAVIIHDATEARQKTFDTIESERLQALTLLAASVAHEIGNPLNALSIHLQLMERELKKLAVALTGGGGNEKASLRRPKTALFASSGDALGITLKLDQYLAVCKGEIARLDYIVTQFLEAIRPAPPQIRPASLNEVVRETLELLRPEIDNRGVTVNEKLARQLPQVPIDPAQIKQVLVNLIKNALHAMTKGGVLTLQTDQGADGVCLTVADTGGGISSERIQHLFKPFFTTKKKGTGLGLMIVQRIIREHHGRIELESRVGQGTLFRIWLPVRKELPPLLSEGKTAEAKPEET